MKALLKAIKVHFDNDAPLTLALSGKLYTGHAPQNSCSLGSEQFPYCVMLEVWNNADRTFSEDTEMYLIQFSIYAKTYEECQSIFELMKGISSGSEFGFDYANLSVPGYQAGAMLRATSTLTYIDEEECWRYMVQYRVDLEKLSRSERE